MAHDAPPSPRSKAPRRPVSKGLLAAIGVAALALPLSQVLQSQSAELSRLAEARARLDPLAQAVHLQWGLVHHERVAERVLQGRRALEDERRLQAAEVGRRIATLRGTLLAGWWTLAERETQALDGDWRRLDIAVARRHIDLAGSRDAHRLLTEQALQVMDLLGAAATPGRALWTAEALTPAALGTWAASLEQDLAGIGEQQAAVHSERRMTLLATAGSLILAALLAWTGRRGGGAPAAAERLRERRGHGRRASDGPPPARPAELAADELRALRAAYDTESPSRL